MVHGFNLSLFFPSLPVCAWCWIRIPATTCNAARHVIHCESHTSLNFQSNQYPTVPINCCGWLLMSNSSNVSHGLSKVLGDSLSRALATEEGWWGALVTSRLAQGWWVGVVWVAPATSHHPCCNKCKQWAALVQFLIVPWWNSDDERRSSQEMTWRTSRECADFSWISISVQFAWNWNYGGGKVVFKRLSETKCGDGVGEKELGWVSWWWEKHNKWTVYVVLHVVFYLHVLCCCQ